METEALGREHTGGGWSALPHMLGEVAFEDSEALRGVCSLLFYQESSPPSPVAGAERSRREWVRDYEVVLAGMSDAASVLGLEPLGGDYPSCRGYVVKDRRMLCRPWFVDFPEREARRWRKTLCRLHQRALEILDLYDPSVRLRHTLPASYWRWRAGRSARISAALAAKRASQEDEE